MAPGRLLANNCGHSISLGALNITLLIPKPVLVPELRGEDVAPGRTVRVECRWAWESGGLCSGSYGVPDREETATHLRETVWPGPHTLGQLDSQSTWRLLRGWAPLPALAPRASSGDCGGQSHPAETLHDCARVLGLRWLSAQVGFLEEEGVLVMCRETTGSKVPEGQRGGKSWPTLSL